MPSSMSSLLSSINGLSSTILKDDDAVVVARRKVEPMVVVVAQGVSDAVVVRFVVILP